MTFFHKIMVAEKKFSSKKKNNFAKGVISKCENDKP